MLPEVDPLPGPQRKLALADGDGKVDGRQRSADVGWHVVVALDRVREERIAVRHEARKEALQIAPHIRVGILLYEQRGRSVAEVQGDQAVAETVLTNPVCNLGGEVIEATSARGDSYLMQSLA